VVFTRRLLHFAGRLDQGGRVPIVDLVAMGVLTVAILRGLWIGLVREAFSLAALGSAVFAVRRFAEPIAEDLAASFQLDPLLATAIAGGGVAVAAILIVAGIGLLVRRALRASGLGLLDRLGGSVLGALEGALFVAMLLFGVITVTGRNDPLIAGTRSLAAFAALESWIGRDGGGEPDPEPTRAAPEQAR
jgi:membrane protein required for colicin V production